ncbi:TPA: multidrug effflux MFS transporter [Klebsiella pneumoniae]|uniref:Transporter, major facilitator family protein n=1 Tax=Klebsiella pneumoniae TaxID=573 RepID=A0A2X3DNL3_KLEPN|nr:MFS transporter [Salmonella enterica subsp. enterica serovar Coeln]SQC25941.1 transporter, major facilitator family protein [Klebsiella pneumoniae]HBZ0070282.1 multidrug effflux MFS transporter [Klebsiella pneumoniae subsp. ozaenae]EHX6213122.1 MFS transporter [Salmonella enterica subsp. enterica serovar Coeln]EHX8198792.1 MFS transporter [Salmonella enterica subsp. enterica serovar Coeln]
MTRIYIYLILAASVSALATDMIVPALPVLQRDLGTDYGTIQLTISGFLMIYAVSQLMSGFAGEKLGKIRILTASFIIFLTGSIICYMAETLYMLMFGRILQAIGAGAGPVLSRAIAKDTLPPKTLKSALSDISSASAVVPLVAPLIGGIILGHLRWNEIFLVMAAFSIITILSTPGGLKQQNKNKSEQSSGNFITPEFIHGTILVSLMLSSLFCYISLSPVIFMETFSLSALHYSVLFSASVLLFIIGNQFSKLERASNPFILFTLNALSLLPFLAESHSLLLCITGAMIFNFTLGAYYPTAYYIALQIKGPKTGVAASVTGFTQTVSAGSISYFAASMTENGIGFSRMLGMSAFTLAVLSIIVIIILKVTQWKTGKSAKSIAH